MNLKKIKKEDSKQIISNYILLNDKINSINDEIELCNDRKNLKKETAFSKKSNISSNFNLYLLDHRMANFLLIVGILVLWFAIFLLFTGKSFNDLITAFFIILVLVVIIYFGVGFLLSNDGCALPCIGLIMILASIYGIFTATGFTFWELIICIAGGIGIELLCFKVIFPPLYESHVKKLLVEEEPEEIDYDKIDEVCDILIKELKRENKILDKYKSVLKKEYCDIDALTHFYSYLESDICENIEDCIEEYRFDDGEYEIMSYEEICKSDEEINERLKNNCDNIAALFNSKNDEDKHNIMEQIESDDKKIEKFIDSVIKKVQ